VREWLLRLHPQQQRYPPSVRNKSCGAIPLAGVITAAALTLVTPKPFASAESTAVSPSVASSTTAPPSSTANTPSVAPTSSVAPPSSVVPSSSAPLSTAPLSTAPLSTAQAAPDSASAPTTSAPAVPGPPISIRFVTVPAGAQATIQAADGSVVTAITPANVTIPSGSTQIVLTASGRVTRSERLDLIAPTTITRWLDPNGQLLPTRYEAKTGSNPKQVAFTPDGTQLWVPLLGSRGVEVFDAATGARLGLVTLGANGGGVEVIFKRDGTRAYVSQMETASVYEIDVATRRVLRRMATGGNWTKVMALSLDEQTLWAANWVSNDISEIDLSSGRLRRKIPTVRTPRGLAVDPTGTALWVAGFENGELTRLDLSTLEQRNLLRTGGAMRHIVIDPRAQRLFADDMGTNAAFSVDLTADASTVAAIKLASTDSHPNTIDLSPDGRLLIVSNRGENNPAGYGNPGPEWGTVIVFDTATGRRLDTIVAGNQTTGLDISDDGRLLAYTDFLDNRLVVREIPPTETLLTGAGGRSMVAVKEKRKAVTTTPSRSKKKPSARGTAATVSSE
jgi:DNA-binding beta-propeller fold protein YncE